MISKRLLIFLSSLTATLVMVLGIQLYRQGKIISAQKENVIKLHQDLGETASLIEIYSNKSQADDDFISKNYEASIELYARISKSTDKFKNLYERRLNNKEKLEEDSVFQNNQVMLNILKARSLFEKNNILANKLDTAMINLYNTEANHKKERAIAEKTNQSLCFQVDSLSKKNIGFLKISKPNDISIQYFGEVSGDSIANGKGTGYWSTGGFYYGEWENGNRHGKGTYTWNDGQRYEGNFENNKRQGFGQYYWKNGNVYIGEWVGNKREGKGKVVDNSQKVIFDGYWEDDELKTNLANEKGMENNGKSSL